MAGVTDAPFRIIAVEMGCALVYTEMVSAKGVLCAPAQTLRIAEFSETERPIGIQLFGSDAVILARGAETCARLQPDFIDINMGCPVKKVTGKGEGCALMRDPEKVYSVTRAVCGAVNLPVTVKIRKGWDEHSANAVEVAKAAEAAGAAAITVHGRTREQGYSGQADWSVITAVKKAVSIPVVGNGDIRDPRDAARMLDETRCDAVMIGRGCLGNPWLLRRTVQYLESGELMPEPGTQEKVEMAIRHLSMMVSSKGEYIGVREMRKHAAWYLKGIPGAAAVRNQIMHTVTEEQMRCILTGLT